MNAHQRVIACLDVVRVKGVGSPCASARAFRLDERYRQGVSWCAWCVAFRPCDWQRRH